MPCRHSDRVMSFAGPGRRRDGAHHVHGRPFSSPDLLISIFSDVMALPYHIYVMATAGTHIQETRHLQYGAAIVVIVLVFL